MLQLLTVEQALYLCTLKPALLGGLGDLALTMSSQSANAPIGSSGGA
jgi:hypothetical protein